MLRLKIIQQAIVKLDEELRSQATCPTCGKPISGIIPNGSTPEKAGLCVCLPVRKDWTNPIKKTKKG